MPVLRMPDDGSLAQSLGSMADAWGQAYDPMLRARAAQMGQSIQLSQFDLARQRAIDAANQNAATVYMNIPHPNDDAATVAETAAAIRAGNYNPDQWATAATTVAKLNAGRTAAGAIQPGSPEFSGASDADIANAKATVLAGGSLPTWRTQQAGANLDTAKTAAVIAAANAASTPDVFPTATAPGSSPATDALIKAGILSGQTAPDIERARAMESINTLPTGTDQTNLNNRSAAITVATGQPPSLQTPLVPGQAQSIVNRNTVADATKEAAIRATTPGRPGDVFRPFGQTAAGGFQVGGRIIIPGPGEKAGDVVPQAAPADTTTSADTTAPAAAAPAPLTTTDASGNTIISPSIEGQTTYAKVQAEQFGKDLEEARDGGAAADKLVPILSVAKQLHDQLTSSSITDQVRNNILQKISDMTGVAVTDDASAIQALGNLIAKQMPDMREELHIRNFAGPEISAIKQMLASPTLTAPVFNLIVNTEMANANMARNRRDVALDAIRGGQPASAYWDNERKVTDPTTNPMWQYFKDNPNALGGNVQPYDPAHPMGAEAPAPPAPPVQTQTPYRINPDTKAPEKLVNGKYVPM
jgi:hypothetical protein